MHHSLNFPSESAASEILCQFGVTLKVLERSNDTHRSPEFSLSPISGAQDIVRDGLMDRRGLIRSPKPISLWGTKSEANRQSPDITSTQEEGHQHHHRKSTVKELKMTLNRREQSADSVLCGNKRGADRPKLIHRGEAVC